MKSFVLALVLRIVACDKELGEYRLYRQAGGLLYDYSGRGFHGRNGNSVQADTNDGLFTDRGAYLNGFNSYIVPHSNEFGPGPVFPQKWGFSMWVFMLQHGPVLCRISTQSNISYYVRTQASNVTVDSNDCSNPICCLLYTSPSPRDS